MFTSFQQADIAWLELCLTAAGGTLPVVENPSSWQQRHLALLEALSTALAGFGGGSLTQMPASQLFGNPTGSAEPPTTIPLANSLVFSGGALTVATNGIQYGMLANTSGNYRLLGNPTSSPGAVTEITVTGGLLFSSNQLTSVLGSIPSDTIVARLAETNSWEQDFLEFSRDGNFSGSADEVVASMAAVAARLKPILALPPSGMDLSPNVSTADYLDISAGDWYIWDGQQIQLLAQATTWTKRLDTAFSEGDNGGLLGTGSIAANTRYFLFAGRKASTGATDYYADTDTNGANAPSGFVWRYRGTLYTNGSAEIKSFRNQGRLFEFDTPPTDFQAYPSTLSNGALYSLDHLPPHQVRAKLRFSSGDQSGNSLHRFAIYAGAPDADLSTFTNVSVDAAVNAVAGHWRNGTSNSQLMTKGQEASFLLDSAEIRLKAAGSSASPSVSPAITIPSYEDLRI